MSRRRPAVGQGRCLEDVGVLAISPAGVVDEKGPSVVLRQAVEHPHAQDGSPQPGIGALQHIRDGCLADGQPGHGLPVQANKLPRLAGSTSMLSCGQQSKSLGLMHVHEILIHGVIVELVLVSRGGFAAQLPGMSRDLAALAAHASILFDRQRKVVIVRNRHGPL